MLKQLNGMNIPEQMQWRITLPEWIRQWNEHTEKGGDVQTALGLLHGIYGANEDEDKKDYNLDRALFLLHLANGHRHVRESGEPYGVERALRDKAFSLLAGKLFKERDNASFQNQPKMLRNALFTFFKGDPRRLMEKNVHWNADIRADTSYADEQASAYLRRFCEFYWDPRHAADTEFRLSLLELLYEQRGLDSLQPTASFEEHKWGWFDEKIREKLQELAQREADTDQDYIRKGVRSGSQAAILLTLIDAAV